jgi:hypothetical protein
MAIGRKVTMSGQDENSRHGSSVPPRPDDHHAAFGMARHTGRIGAQEEIDESRFVRANDDDIRLDAI